MATASPTPSIDQCDKKEDELERMALEEIIKETKWAKERAQTMGPIGWVKCPLQPTNKIFLRNVLKGAVENSNRKTTKDFRESHKRSGTIDKPVLDFSNSSPSKDRTQFDTNPREENRSQHSASFSDEKYPKRNVHASEDSEENSTDTKEVLRTSKGDIKTNEKHSPSRKHKLKHKSKHKHKKKKK